MKWKNVKCNIYYVNVIPTLLYTCSAIKVILNLYTVVIVIFQASMRLSKHKICFHMIILLFCKQHISAVYI